MKVKANLPNSLIKELNDLIRQEQYIDLYCAFPDTISDDLDYLMLDLKQATHLLSAAYIEHSRACLKYPYRIDDEKPFDPDHEEKFDDIQHFYEKISLYLGLAIKKMEESQTKESV